MHRCAPARTRKVLMLSMKRTRHAAAFGQQSSDRRVLGADVLGESSSGPKKKTAATGELMVKKSFYKKRHAFDCSHCTNQYNSRKKLKEHIFLAHDELLQVDTFRGFTLRPEHLFSVSKMLENNVFSTFPFFYHPQVYVSERNVKEEDNDCDYCRYKASDASDLERHITDIHSVEKELSCNQCLHIANSIFDLENHLAINHSPLFSSQHEPRSTHGEADGIERQFPCAHCDFRALNRRHLRQHIIALHTEVKPYACTLCDYSTVRPRKLRYHMAAKHHKKQVYECGFCNYEGFSAGKLKQHKQAVHNRLRLHPCPYCNFFSPLERNLREHILSKHSMSRPYLCNRCGYRTAHPNLLRQHILQKHKKVRPFQCKRCKYCAGSAYLLQRHLVYHGFSALVGPIIGRDPEPGSNQGGSSSAKTPKSKKYFCAYCTIGFVHRCSLTDHIAIRHYTKLSLTEINMNELKV